MYYVNEKIKSAYRVPQPEGRGAYIRLDQNENRMVFRSGCLNL